MGETLHSSSVDAAGPCVGWDRDKPRPRRTAFRRRIHRIHMTVAALFASRLGRSHGSGKITGCGWNGGFGFGVKKREVPSVHVNREPHRVSLDERAQRWDNTFGFQAASLPRWQDTLEVQVACAEKDRRGCSTPSPAFIPIAQHVILTVGAAKRRPASGASKIWLVTSRDRTRHET